MPIIPISDANDTRLQDYLKLTDHQLRSRVDLLQARIICESRYVLEAACDMHLEALSLFIDERHLESLTPLIERLPADTPVYTATADLMSSIVGFEVTRGYYGCFRRPQPADIHDILTGARRVVVLESIVDTTNVGAIFRSAAALGADGILLAPSCADPLSRRALRVSMGNVLKVPWARFDTPWPSSAFELLHAEGFCCAALALDEHAITLDDPQLAYEERLALFFGTEGDGLSHRALEGCDRIVTIPMAHEVDSLNVAAACAVTLWELRSKN